MTNRRPQSSPMGQWHDMPGCKVKRDLESWGKPCESSRPPQEPAATTLTGSSGCCGEGDTEVHPSTEAEMGRRQSSAGLWPQNSGRRALGKRKLRQIGRCGGTQGWLFGPVTPFCSVHAQEFEHPPKHWAAHHPAHRYCCYWPAQPRCRQWQAALLY